MSIFDKCLSLRENINDLDDTILEMRSGAYSPSTQVLSFAPSRSNYKNNNMEVFLVEVECFEAKRSYLLKELEKLWIVIENRARKMSFSEDRIVLLKLRFYFGLTWAECCKKMQEVFPTINWNQNLVFKIYRDILNEYYSVYS